MSEGSELPEVRRGHPGYRLEGRIPRRPVEPHVTRSRGHLIAYPGAAARTASVFGTEVALVEGRDHDGAVWDVDAVWAHVEPFLLAPGASAYVREDC